MANLSIEPGDLNVTAWRGTTWRITQTVRDSGGNLVNLTGYDCTWAMASQYGGSAVLTSTVGTGITLGGTAGTITHVVSATATAGVAIGEYVHQYELTEPSGGKPPFTAGVITVKGEVVTS